MQWYYSYCRCFPVLYFLFCSFVFIRFNLNVDDKYICLHQHTNMYIYRGGVYIPLFLFRVFRLSCLLYRYFFFDLLGIFDFVLSVNDNFIIILRVILTYIFSLNVILSMISYIKISPLLFSLSFFVIFITVPLLIYCFKIWCFKSLNCPFDIVLW